MDQLKNILTVLSYIKQLIITISRCYHLYSGRGGGEIARRLVGESPPGRGGGSRLVGRGKAGADHQMRGEPAEGGGGGGGGGGQGEEEDRRQDCHSSLSRRFEATEKFLIFQKKTGRRSLFCRGLQRDVVYLGWPTAPSYMRSNAGGWGELRRLSQWVQLYTGAQINFEKDLTPIFNLCCYAVEFFTDV